MVGELPLQFKAKAVAIDILPVCREQGDLLRALQRCPFLGDDLQRFVQQILRPIHPDVGEEVAQLGVCSAGEHHTAARSLLDGGHSQGVGIRAGVENHPISGAHAPGCGVWSGQGVDLLRLVHGENILLRRAGEFQDVFRQHGKVVALLLVKIEDALAFKIVGGDGHKRLIFLGVFHAGVGVAQRLQVLSQQVCLHREVFRQCLPGQGDFHGLRLSGSCRRAAPSGRHASVLCIKCRHNDAGSLGGYQGGGSVPARGNLQIQNGIMADGHIR